MINITSREKELWQSSTQKYLTSANSNIFNTYLIYKIDKTECPLYAMYDGTNGLFFT